MSPEGSPALLSRFVGLIALVSPVPVQADDVGLDTHIVDDLGLDSITQVALMALTEEHFSVPLSAHMDALLAIQTVGDVIALVQRIRTH